MIATMPDLQWTVTFEEFMFGSKLTLGNLKKCLKTDLTDRIAHAGVGYERSQGEALKHRIENKNPDDPTLISQLTYLLGSISKPARWHKVIEFDQQFGRPTMLWKFLECLAMKMSHDNRSSELITAIQFLTKHRERGAEQWTNFNCWGNIPFSIKATACWLFKINSKEDLKVKSQEAIISLREELNGPFQRLGKEVPAIPEGESDVTNYVKSLPQAPKDLGEDAETWFEIRRMTLRATAKEYLVRWMESTSQDTRAKEDDSLNEVLKSWSKLEQVIMIEDDFLHVKEQIFP